MHAAATERKEKKKVGGSGGKGDSDGIPWKMQKQRRKTNFSTA